MSEVLNLIPLSGTRRQRSLLLQRLVNQKSVMNPFRVGSEHNWS